MKKEHPEVENLKNVCDTSKTPKQVCEVVKKEEQNQKQNKKEITSDDLFDRKP